MNAKVIGIIGVIAIAVLAIAFLAGRQSDRSRTEITAPDEHLFPALNQRMNDVARVHIQDNITSVTLQRTNGTWGLVQQAGYPVRFDQVRKTIIDAAGLKKVEEKTSNPDLYTRLDVEDVTAPDAKGMLVKFDDKDGQNIASLIVGRPYYPPGGGGGAQQFVRPVDEKASWLVAGSLQLQADPRTWLETTLFNVPGDRIQSVLIQHADGEELRISKATPEERNYVLETLPEDREVAAENRMNELSNLFLNLRLDEVRPACQITKGATLVASAEGRTFDGLIVQAKTVEMEGTRYTTFEAHVDLDAIVRINESRMSEARDLQATVKAKGNGEGAVEENPVPELIEETDVQAEADKINSTVNGWAYVLPMTQKERLVRRNAFYLKEPEAANSQGPPPPEAPPAAMGESMDIQALIEQMRNNPEMVPEAMQIPSEE